MINVVLCGGMGSRLWPLSRKSYPKQFISLIDGESLFQLTLKRARTLAEETILIGGEETYFLAQDQLKAIGISEKSVRLMLEPVGRNTAAAIAFAAVMSDADDVLLVAPSDHLIRDEKAFQSAVKQAEKLAKQGRLVTFGIVPESAHTGYGYIEAGEDGEVKNFHEKPGQEMAQKYLETGGFYWNSGLFCFKAGVFLEELKRHQGDVYSAVAKAMADKEGAEKEKMVRVDLEAMMAIPEISVDYAVMEKSENVVVVPMDVGWSDVGCFDQVADVFETDVNGNTISDQFVGVNARDNVVISRDRLVAAVGVEDLIIVDTEDAVLVSKRGKSQEVRELVKLIGDERYTDEQPTMFRPWGKYQVLLGESGYQVKRISVKPGCRLSLQRHAHRDEHWTVVEGNGVFELDGVERDVSVNDQMVIQKGQWHRISGGKTGLVFVEVQLGGYLGEDDIERKEDDFGRV